MAVIVVIVVILYDCCYHYCFFVYIAVLLVTLILYKERNVKVVKVVYFITLMAHHIEKPILAVDIVLFAMDVDEKDIHPKVLLIQRKYDPFKGQWALPGGHVE